ncbi:MAG: RNA 2',3'-cyclic phosphodiesterase [Nitrospirae bacterium]|nr:RNA 2',3'-cyclic phosphodiesterase [Nitrospirota bacterium]MBI5096224.1 RNA 2',3'-cyclic phosphodiesterase [Nitrospirota bacterium]
MRCFISITLPAEIKRGMMAIQGRLRASGADVSWTRPEGMHLTLKFLGEVEEKMLPEMEAALSAAVRGRSPFSLKVSGIGTFPDLRRPRVIWIGLREHGNNLIRLQRGVEEEFNKIGFSSEGREFTPHITLGRIRSQRHVEKLLSLIEKERDVELNGFDASCVHLMQSQLRPTGAVYTERYSVELQG